MSRKNLSILIVEDDVLTQKITSLFATSLGHHVYIASNGRSALEKMMAEDFDLVLMDLGLPDVDGITVVERVRFHEEQHNKKRSKIYAFTAHSDEDIRQKCAEVEMDGFINKPLTVEALAEILKEI